MNTSTTRVIICQGISGAGKSSYANGLLRDKPGRICSADDYFLDHNDVYQFDQAKLGSAHAWCFGRYLKSIEAGAGIVVVDNTNLNPVDVSPYVMGAAAYGVPWQIVQVGRDPETAFLRNVHGLTRVKVRKQHERLMNFFAPKHWWDHVTAVGDLEWVSALARRNAEQEKKNGNKDENEAA